MAKRDADHGSQVSGNAHGQPTPAFPKLLMTRIDQSRTRAGNDARSPMRDGRAASVPPHKRYQPPLDVDLVRPEDASLIVRVGGFESDGGAALP